MTNKKRRERGLREHRRMWRWIAKQYRKGDLDSIWWHKSRYIKMNRNKWGTMYGKFISADCFCCWSTWTKYQRNCPFRCPVVWGDFDRYEQEGEYVQVMCEGEGSPYKDLQDLLSSSIGKECQEICKEASRLAMEIANLPERRVG